MGLSRRAAAFSDCREAHAVAPARVPAGTGQTAAQRLVTLRGVELRWLRPGVAGNARYVWRNNRNQEEDKQQKEGHPQHPFFARAHAACFLSIWFRTGCSPMAIALRAAKSHPGVDQRPFGMEHVAKARDVSFHCANLATCVPIPGAKNQLPVPNTIRYCNLGSLSTI